MAEEQHDEQDKTVTGAPLGGTRAQAMQRLQVGLFGLAAMILMIGLAQIIMNQAREAEAGIVPEAAPTVTPTEKASPASDPLADAGVGPDLDEQPQAQPTATSVPDASARQAD